MISCLWTILVLLSFSCCFSCMRNWASRRWKLKPSTIKSPLCFEKRLTVRYELVRNSVMCFPYFKTYFCTIFCSNWLRMFPCQTDQTTYADDPSPSKFFSTRTVDPSHAINLTHVHRNRNTLLLAVDHPSIGLYWSMLSSKHPCPSVCNCILCTSASQKIHTLAHLFHTLKLGVQTWASE